MRFLMALLILTGLAQNAAACGPDSDCEIGERTYRIALPNAAQAPVGALIYAHGYRGSAKGAMRNKAMIALAHEHGLALVATKSASDDWIIPGVPQDPGADGSIEYDYYDAVIADLAARHGIDTSRLVATGFSAGAMMVWNLACHRGDRFAALIPLAGTFWEPVPDTCPSAPVQMVHVHGTGDKIVPLGGRAIANTRQGDVFQALDIMAEAGGYGHPGPVPGTADLSCAQRSAPGGEILGFCTHPGGHSLKMDYLRHALAMLRGAGVL